MGGELIDARDAHTVPRGGEYVVRLTMYAEDGSVIVPLVYSWPGDGIVIFPGRLDALAGQPVHAVLVQPMFRPDGA